MSNVAVFCGGARDIHERYLLQAFRVGQIVASQGHTLVYGGGNAGMSKRLADGFLSEATTAAAVAVVAPATAELCRRPDGRCTTVVYESLGARKEAMFAMSQLAVVLPGGIGTLDELLHLLAMRSTRRTVPRFVVCDYWLDFADLFRYFRTVVEKKFAREQTFACDIVSSEAELLSKLAGQDSSGQ